MKTIEKNYSFWSWEHNKLDFWVPSSYIALVIILIVPLIVALNQKRVHAWYERKQKEKIWVFKNIDSLLQVVGLFLLVLISLRTILFFVYDYPLRWEIIPLHLCRIHLIIISLLLIFKRKEYLIYLAYIGFIGALIGVGAGRLQITEATREKMGSDLQEIWSKYPGYVKGAGADTFAFWEFYIIHIAVGIIPISIYIASRLKITTINLYRMILLYIGTAWSFWALNAILDTYSPSLRWRSNYWYLGKDSNNDFKDAMGFATRWPQNMFFVPIIAGGILFYTSHIFSMLASRDFKRRFKSFIKDHKFETIRNVLNFKTFKPTEKRKKHN